MYQEILTKLGLNANEAHIYELLLTKGRTKARDLLTDSGLGRGNLYNVLTSLVSQGLATVTEGKQQVYEAAEPSHLATLVDDQKRRADRLAQEFQGELPKLLSTFNLTTGKPAIQVFEGIEGFERALFDSLTEKGEVLTYIDVLALQGPFAEVNARYMKQRAKFGIAKRVIMADEPAIREFVKKNDSELTKVHLIPNFPVQFQTIVEIYGSRVAYLSLSSERCISVIIDDVNIANFERTRFEFLWTSFRG
ncbi:TPA: hypothetical protein DEP96_02145 [Candidatus Uhrbacteria bacterium]|nr:hypothetical protein [Candidatus Uhrbacteria bacterium]